MNASPSRCSSGPQSRIGIAGGAGVGVDVGDVGLLDVAGVQHQLAVAVGRSRSSRRAARAGRRRPSTSEISGTPRSRHGSSPSRAATIALDTRFLAPQGFVSKAMVAALLAEEPCRLRGRPARSRDVKIVTGPARAARRQDRLHRPRRRAAARPDATSSRPTSPTSTRTPAPRRVPVLLCGPLLHRLGEAFIPDLGGCRIGERPINYHLDVLRQFGADVQKRPEGCA